MKKLTPILENRAVDLYAHTPNITHGEVATKLGISNKTLMKLRRSANFWTRVYSEFCIHMEGELPSIVKAMGKEALAGNVQAGKLILEWAGKLDKTLNIHVSSPFEKWMELENRKNMPEDAEIVLDQLPDRKADNSREAVEEGFAKLDKELIKKEQWYARRKELYRWHKRAKLVDVEPLPPRRPTKGQRLAWEESIVKAEKEYGGK